MADKRLVYGVGINDLKYTEKTIHQKEYTLWRDVLKRCYCEQYLTRFPTYRNVKMVSEWLTYSCFKKDISKLKNFEKLYEGWVLDKDICSDDKVYSKETCCIVPQQVNIFFSTFSTNHNPAYDARVDFYYCYCCHNGKKKYLGRYKTKEESYKVYLAYKILVIEDMINKYNHVLDSRVITRLSEYKEVLKNEQV